MAGEAVKITLRGVYSAKSRLKIHQNRKKQLFPEPFGLLENFSK
ncbi:hypothetical protein [uncultured Microbulbifer sp.]|nr:hypothetical protein [uncultured Microbulbifer sp.]